MRVWAVAERARALQLGARLGEEVLARDAEIGDAVTDELDHVVRPDEEDVEIEVPNASDQAPLVLLEDEPRVAQQLDRRLEQPALVGHGEAQALPRLEGRHDSRPAG